MSDFSDNPVERSMRNVVATLRVWTLTGGQTVRAKFDIARNSRKKLKERVRLLGENGQSYRVPIPRLSPADREFVASAGALLYPADSGTATHVWKREITNGPTSLSQEIELDRTSSQIVYPPREKDGAAKSPRAVGNGKRAENADGGAAVDEALRARAARRFKSALKLAQSGDAASQVQVGRYYEEGDGVEQNGSEAARWYRKAISSGSDEALFYLARCYEHGIGVEADSAKAMNGYRKASSRGVALANVRLAQAYETGFCVEPNERKAARYYILAASADLPSAQFEVAKRFDDGRGVDRNVEEATRWLRKAAKRRYAPAQFALAERYANGQAGLEEDPEEAFELYRSAANAGYADAQIKLAE